MQYWLVRQKEAEEEVLACTVCGISHIQCLQCDEYPSFRFRGKKEACLKYNSLLEEAEESGRPFLYLEPERIIIDYDGGRFGFLKMISEMRVW